MGAVVSVVMSVGVFVVICVGAVVHWSCVEVWMCFAQGGFVWSNLHRIRGKRLPFMAFRSRLGPLTHGQGPLRKSQQFLGRTELSHVPPRSSDTGDSICLYGRLWIV
jgi:hypothetical protein